MTFCTVKYPTDRLRGGGMPTSTKFTPGCLITGHLTSLTHTSGAAGWERQVALDCLVPILFQLLGNLTSMNLAKKLKPEERKDQGTTL